MEKRQVVWNGLKERVKRKKNNDIDLSCCLTKSLLQLHHNAALFNKWKHQISGQCSASITPGNIRKSLYVFSRRGKKNSPEMDNKLFFLLTHLFPMYLSSLYHLKTSENYMVFWCFLGVEKGCIGNKWVNDTCVLSGYRCHCYRSTLHLISDFKMLFWEYFKIRFW